MAGFTFSPMDIVTARTIADEWKYEPPYDFYDATADREDYEEFVDPGSWPEIFYAARSEGKLSGFFSMTRSQDGFELGLGMRPDLVGQGTGIDFVSACLDYAHQNCGVIRSVFLNVAAFNVRAIRVYERLGFVTIYPYQQTTNGSVFEFLRMERGAREDRESSLV